MSTLRYADQAKSIVNSVRINEDPFARTVRRLNLEVSETVVFRADACYQGGQETALSPPDRRLLCFSIIYLD